VSFHILAVDTTGEFGSLALSDDGRVLEVVALHSPEGFGHVLFDQIQDLLGRHRLSLADLDGFAAAAGPGSFTGVRVGLTAVKGLAEAMQRKVVAVSNLAALAWFGTRSLRAVAMDARRGEVYGAVYDAALRLVRDEVVMKFADWIGTLPEGDPELIAGGFVPPPVDLAVTQAPPALAGAIASIAAVQFAGGLGKDPAEVDANYVRRSDAELLWRDPPR
jgi:tRNA threonylcarbamoyladenosine biosynthesis protein TsaB